MRLLLYSKEVYQDADARTERFKEAAKAYEQAAVDADPNYKSKFDWEHAHTWEEVLDEVEKAVNSNKDASKLWGKIRKAFRSLGNNSKVFSAWLQLLPNQSQYCSILCGGLILIIGVRCRQVPWWPALRITRLHLVSKAFGKKSVQHLCKSHSPWQEQSLYWRFSTALWIFTSVVPPSIWLF